MKLSQVLFIGTQLKMNLVFTRENNGSIKVWNPCDKILNGRLMKKGFLSKYI